MRTFFRPAAKAPTASIIVFFILVVSFFNIFFIDNAPRYNWKYVGIGNPSAHDIKLVIMTKQIIKTKIIIIG
ncbi:MAG: hypothetical protein CVT93_00850 [Bacteroidetes bacterium HGW-Bacteroidetes-10]|nr:MAG: hypothetical protein CVT93_00850 [Bacteroidetes bacterium HGW-Bacteroidetes-10]